jgi:hypothetical protein
MKFITVEIKGGKDEIYNRLINALELSIKTNCPDDIFERHILEPKDYPDEKHIKWSYYANSMKLRYWSKLLENETENICFIDGDTIVLGDINHVFDNDYDLAYTLRSKGVRIPVNGGVLFVRSNERSKAFFRKWSEINNRMIKDPVFHKKYYPKYAGINQASFGWMLENYTDAKLISVPCAVYNACDAVDWINPTAETKIIHIKSNLRMQCLYGLINKQYRKVYDLFRTYDKAEPDPNKIPTLHKLLTRNKIKP